MENFFSLRKAAIAAVAVLLLPAVMDFKAEASEPPMRVNDNPPTENQVYEIRDLINVDFTEIMKEGSLNKPVAIPTGTVPGLDGWTATRLMSAGGAAYIDTECHREGISASSIGNLMSPMLDVRGASHILIKVEYENVVPADSMRTDWSQAVINYRTNTNKSWMAAKTWSMPYSKNAWITSDNKTDASTFDLPETMMFYSSAITPAEEAPIDKIFINFRTTYFPIAIKSIKVQGWFPKVKTPTGLDYTNFTENGFIATWNKVDGATKYIARAFTAKYVVSTGKYLYTQVDKQEVTTNSAALKVNTNGLCFFNVQAMKDNDESDWSPYYRVYDVCKPVLSDQKEVGDSINVAYTRPGGSMGIQTWAYRTFKLPKAINEYPLIKADFTKCKMEQQAPYKLAIDDILCGWDALPYAYYIDGTLLITNGGHLYFGQPEGRIASNCYYDLSQGSQMLKVKVRAKRQLNDGGLRVVVKGFNKETQRFEVLDEMSVALSSKLEDYNFELDGGKNPNAMFSIDCIDTNGGIQVASFSISASMEEGAEIKMPYAYKANSLTSIRMPKPEKTLACDNVMLTSRSIKRTVVQQSNGQFALIGEAYSNFSEPVTAEMTPVKLNIELSEKEIGMDLFDIKKITANVQPQDTKDPLVWMTSNPKVAVVEDGEITKVGNGDCEIYAVCANAIATCKILNGAGIESITADEEANFDVYDISGRIVLRGASNEDLKGLNKGIYILRSGNKSEKYITR